MRVNLLIYAVFAVAAAVCVLFDARRRRAREADEHDEQREGGDAGAAPVSHPGSDNWECETPDPARWTALTLFLAPLGFPAYFARGKRPIGAVLAAAIAVGACIAALNVEPLYEFNNPLQPAKPVPWSRFPPGLPESVRKATEQLPSELATQVIDILPGLIAVGQSYPGGADISVTPSETEARVLMQIKEEGFVVMAALRIYAARDVAQRVMTEETREKSPRKVKLGGERRGILLESDHHVELYERYGDVLAHLYVQQDGDEATKADKKAIKSETKRLAEKLAKEMTKAVAH